ncbi:MAG: hypothetical protein RXO54_07320 [Acidilobus sp.]
MVVKRSIITGYTILTLKTPDGRPIMRIVKPFDSLLRNFIVMLETLFKGMDTLLQPPQPSTVTNTAGASVSLTFPTPNGAYGIPLGWRVDADAGDILILRGEPTDWGILVGSDNSPTTINFWNLGSPYPHGKSVGYMNYLSTTISQPAFDGTSVNLSIERLIVNEADVSQLVYEVGLVAREYNTWTKFLIARDVLDTPISMPPKSLLDVTIVIQGLLAPYQVFYRKDYAVGSEASTKSVV